MTDDQDDDLPARLVPPGPGGQGRTFWKVTPRGLRIVEELAGRGCHLTTIARVLGMDVATLREVRRRDPEVDEAYQRGLAREHDALVGNLRAAADEGNVVANIFLLKSRHQYREGEALEANLNLTVNTGGVLLIPNKMTVEEFLREREGAGGRIPGQPEDPDVIEHRPLDPEARRGD
ncbi:hypothetical protein [Gemmobacter nectariphilus]|uniref:hypothetical protein n=1 Tax=Gemmobacter nectariphilus TaxID=220343 RepID=UPI000687396D|nr:hypothetical protein [Gemmobacter nectariphilus]